MARARNIKPSFFKNEDLSELSPYARLLFIGLWCLADREGLLEDRPKRIKGELFPYENVDVDKYLQDLHDTGFILRYEVDGNRYISIPKFADHQNPHHREAKSKLPKPCQSTEKNGTSFNQGEVQPSESPGLSEENPDKGKGKPDESRADSLIPDSLNLIPDSPLPTSLQSDDQGKEVVVVGGRPLHVFKSVIDQYKYYFAYEPNKTIRDLLHSYLDDGVQMDMIAWAMRNATEKGKAWDYARGTIEKLFVRGVRTAEQAEQADREFQQQREQRQSRKVVPIREDKLPASVQWQQEQERSGAAMQTVQETRTVADDPELAEMLRNLQRTKKAGC